MELPQTLHICSALQQVEDNATANISHHWWRKVAQQEHAVMILLVQLHHIIRRRDSPWNSFKDTILFNIDVLGCVDLKCLVRDGKGLSHCTIENMTAIYYLTIGIYKEMTAHLFPSEPIILGTMIDLGYRKLKNLLELE